jgi:hypothetical protein
MPRPGEASGIRLKLSRSKAARDRTALDALRHNRPPTRLVGLWPLADSTSAADNSRDLGTSRWQLGSYSTSTAGRRERPMTAFDSVDHSSTGTQVPGSPMDGNGRGARCRKMALFGHAESAPGLPLWAGLCCKSPKSQSDQFFAKTGTGKQSLIRIASFALPKSPVSLTSGDEVPHIFTRKPRLRPAEFLNPSVECTPWGGQA